MGILKPLLWGGGAIVAVAGAIAVRSWVTAQRASIAAGKERLNQTLPVHSAWWREHAGTEGEILYVAIGDSAAQGIGASVPHNSYVGVIADHIRAATGRSVQVRLNRCSGGHYGVYSAEVDHPLSAQRDCFIVRCTATLWRGRMPFHKTSLPETAVLARSDWSPQGRMSALMPSLTPPSSSRDKASISDWN